MCDFQNYAIIRMARRVNTLEEQISAAQRRAGSGFGGGGGGTLYGG